jgi:hypothetical protein
MATSGKSRKETDGMLHQLADPNNIEKFLSKELESLTVRERTQVQEEIHGVSNLCPEETPEMVEEALKSMQQHLVHIQHKPIYDQLSPFSYLHTREWRLRFLRCELFDCQKAAKRLVRFTEYMESEYDMEVLERPLRLSDLRTKSGKRGKEVMESFRSGHAQLFPFRDRSGRRIFVELALEGLCEIVRYHVFCRAIFHSKFSSIDAVGDEEIPYVNMACSFTAGCTPIVFQ